MVRLHEIGFLEYADTDWGDKLPRSLGYSPEEPLCPPVCLLGEKKQYFRYLEQAVGEAQRE
jgi:hypothetical protein